MVLRSMVVLIVDLSPKDSGMVELIHHKLVMLVHLPSLLRGWGILGSRVNVSSATSLLGIGPESVL
jgi:hypothetical protein